MQHLAFFGILRKSASNMNEHKSLADWKQGIPFVADSNKEFTYVPSSSPMCKSYEWWVHAD